MKDCKKARALAATIAVLTLGGLAVHAQQKPAASTAQVHVVITDSGLRSDADVPRLRQDEVKIKQGKTYLQVTQLIPAQGDNAALQLIILIDDTLDTSVGNNLNDIREFIKAQPSSAVVGVGYMSNAGVNMIQNFTPDKELAVKAVRLPRGAFSTMDSPYLSLISLVKGWPQQNVRREVLMVTDGIDRLRGEKPQPSQLGPNPQKAIFGSPSVRRSVVAEVHSDPLRKPRIDSHPVEVTECQQQCISGSRDAQIIHTQTWSVGVASDKILPSLVI